jgi:hypothetical protein
MRSAKADLPDAVGPAIITGRAAGMVFKSINALLCDIHASATGGTSGFWVILALQEALNPVRF